MCTHSEAAVTVGLFGDLSRVRRQSRRAFGLCVKSGLGNSQAKNMQKQAAEPCQWQGARAFSLAELDELALLRGLVQEVLRDIESEVACSMAGASFGLRGRALTTWRPWPGATAAGVFLHANASHAQGRGARLQPSAEVSLERALQNALVNVDLELTVKVTRAGLGVEIEGL